MKDLDRPRARLTAAALTVALLAPSFLAPFSSAGVLSRFGEGPDAVIVAGLPGSLGTLPFPNPARAVAASLTVSTASAVAAGPLGAPERSWWSELSGPAGAVNNLSLFQANRLSPGELAAAATAGGSNFSVSTLTAKPAILVEYNLTGLALTLPVQAADIVVLAQTDGVSVPEILDFDVLLFVEAPGAPAGWRSADLTQGLVVSAGQSGTAWHPPIRAAGADLLLDLLIVPRSEAFRGLLLDGLSVTLSSPRVPVGATLVVNETGESVWRYEAPGGGDAGFGWTTEFADGTRDAMLASNGSAVAGFTPDVFVPENATVSGASFEVAPVPYETLATARSNLSTYRLPPFSATTEPGPLSVPGIPVVAHSVRALLTLYNLTAHGVIDARHEATSLTQSIGNFSSFEQAAAQTVTVERNGTLESVSLNLGNTTGHAVGPLVLEVRNVSAGQPGTLTLALGTTNLSAARPGGWVTFALSTPLPVLAGAQFALVLASPGAGANETWDWRGRNGVTTDPYAGGGALLSLNASGQPPWAPQTNTDMAFRLLLSTPFNEGDIASISLAGSSGPPLRHPNYIANWTGWHFLVVGPAAQLTPDFSGGAFWNSTLVSSLPYAVDFAWNAWFHYALFPRNVELAVGNRSAFLTVPELSGPLLVDAQGDFANAFSLHEGAVAMGNGTAFQLLPIRVRADGPGALVVFSPDLTFGATVPVGGLAPALNRALSAVDRFAGAADVHFELRAAGLGAVLLSALNVLYSQRPFTPPIVGPPVEVSEGSQNVTVADLYQWFADDLDGIFLNYSVESVFPAPMARADIFESGVDANLTLTLRDMEYSGPVSIRVRGTDSTGLSSEQIFDVLVIAVPDPPWVLPIPDIALANTTGTFELAPYIRDNDTALASLALSVSSVFGRLSGTVLTFDYRQAPSSLLSENITLWVNDSTTNTSAAFRVLVNNAGRPLITTPPPIPATEGHNLTIFLDPFVSDDRDAKGQLVWGLLRVVGVGAIPGDATARVDPAIRALEFRGTAIGDVEVGLTVEDTDRNLATGVVLLRVTANLPPSFGGLDGLKRSLRAGDELRLNLSEYLNDPDDALANFTFSLAWDNGTVVTADKQGSVLVIRSLGGAGGQARVTVVATDPAGASVSATVVVDAEPGVGGGGLQFNLLGAALAVGVAGYLIVSYRKGKARQASLGSLHPEQAQVETDGQDNAALRGHQGLEETDEERMDHKLEDLEKEAATPRHALPPVSIITPEGALTATELVLAYRDGRPLSWVRTAAPGEGDTERAQELAAALETRARAMRQGGRIEGETLSAGAKQYLVEARSQLVLAALPESGANAAALRMQMRAAIDAVFDANALPLKRWDGSRAELKRVEDLLEKILKVD